jgi:hypothetical protein
MLKLTSRFVLQVLPYLLMALAVVVLLPGVADSLLAAAFRDATSQRQEIEPFSTTTLDLIRQDHETFASNGLLQEIAKAAEVDLERH